MKTLAAIKSLSLLTLFIGSAQAQSIALNDSDQVRFSWREVSASKDAEFALSIEMKVCSATAVDKKASCVALGTFAKADGKITAGSPTEIKKNTDWLSGAEINAKIAKSIAGKSNALTRLTATLYSYKNGFPTQVDEQYLSFPALDQRPEAGKDKMQMKMVLKSAEIRTRLLVEIKR